MRNVNNSAQRSNWICVVKILNLNITRHLIRFANYYSIISSFTGIYLFSTYSKLVLIVMGTVTDVPQLSPHP